MEIGFMTSCHLQPWNVLASKLVGEQLNRFAQEHPHEAGYRVAHMYA